MDRFNECSSRAVRALLGIGTVEDRRPDADRRPDRQRQAKLVGWIASLARLAQSGFIYHYAIAMIVGVAVLLWWFVPLVKH
jgi:NADH-quinone oxidoreductase subunit L